MNIADLVEFVDLKTFLVLQTGLIVLAIRLFKPICYGVYDSAWITILGLTVGVTIVTYWAIFEDELKYTYALYMGFSLVFFLSGARLTGQAYMFMRPKRPRFDFDDARICLLIKQLYSVLGFLQLAIIILIFLRAAMQGLPILAADPEQAKVEINTAGFGLITRLLNPSTQLALSIIFLLQSLKSLRGARLFLQLLPALLVLLSSGSKSALFVILVCYTVSQAYLMGVINLYRPPNGRKILSYVVVGGLVYAGIVLLLRAIGTGESDPVGFVVSTFVVRLFAFGDAAFYFFVSDINNAISYDFYNFFWDYLFAPVLALVRVVEYPTTLGLKIVFEMFGLDGKTGPNPTMYVEGFAYFGILGGASYAFFLGILFQALRSNCFSRHHKISAWRYIWFSLLFPLAQLVPVDMILFFGELPNVLLVAGFIWLSLFIKSILRPAYLKPVYSV